MRTLNEGMVKTNDRCIGCNRCIASCPVSGANIAKVVDGRGRVFVESDNCIHCGACIDACHRGARDYEDDTEAFFEALKAGEKVSLVVDISFVYLHSDQLYKIFGYLKSIGVDLIYDAGIGCEISVWAHTKYFRDHYEEPDRAFIVNSCSAVRTYFSKYVPRLLDVIAPVQSPASCMVTYIKKYLKDTNSIAFLAPCPSRGDVCGDGENGIKYLVTMKKFMKALRDVDFSKYEEIPYDHKGDGLGILLDVEMGFSKALTRYFTSDQTILHRDKLESDVIDTIVNEYTNGNPALRPRALTISACQHGCMYGAGAGLEDCDRFKVNEAIQHLKEYCGYMLVGNNDPEENWEILDNRISKRVNFEDFSEKYVSQYKQTYRIPDSTYVDIYDLMHKDTEWKKHIDCGSCGYTTCREMVEAIAYGYNKMENCIHYMNDELTIRYYTDPLTKIPNKEGFRARVAQIYKNNPDKTYIIGVVSINQLNMINDLHGFKHGDWCICKAAQISTEFTVPEGGCAGRLGGGEFLLCFENKPELVDRIHNAGTYTFEEMAASFPLSFRAGLYIDRDRSESLDTMINYASLARDKIEEDGVSTCLYYNDELRERLALEAMITSQMYSALARKEFVPYFQPQYSHRNQTIVGAETLCRWVKPDGSIISPGLFIPIFEKNGFIKTLDKYMWEQAFMVISEWTKEGLPAVPISVNISRVSLNEADFIDTINKLFVKYPIDPALLHFEITESAYSDRQDMVAKKINAVRGLGFKVAMDDFGSGYSSLNVLKDMPLDILKLDMGFLRGRNQDKGESIIRNVVSMVRELDFNIISEGVETLDQAEFLKHVGCDIIQGYLYARPMPRQDYEELLLNSASAAGSLGIRGI